MKRKRRPGHLKTYQRVRSACPVGSVPAFENLRAAGVPFGIVDFYFNRLGAFCGWYFQSMPIGRRLSMDLMVTPGQRMEMLRRTWSLVVDRRLVDPVWRAEYLAGAVADAAGGQTMPR